MDNFDKILSFGSTGVTTEKLTSPTSIAAYDDRLYIGDGGNNRLLVWSIQGGKFIAQITGVYAAAIVANDAYIWVLDSVAATITRYSRRNLHLKLVSAVLPTPLDMVMFNDLLYVITGTTITTVSPNTLVVTANVPITGTAGTYVSLAASKTDLYLLTTTGSGGNIYQVFPLTATFDKSYAITEVIVPGRIRWHDNLLWVIGTSDNFILVNADMILVADALYASADWTSCADIATRSEHRFWAVDVLADSINLLYGYDYGAGVASGDDIEFGDWDFDDDIIIGGDEANLSHVGFVRSNVVDPATKLLWRKV